MRNILITGSCKTVVFFLCLLYFCPSLYAGYKDDIGYTLLGMGNGQGVPKGDNVLVTQVEGKSSGHWMPDVDADEFLEKTFFDHSGDSEFSGHATTVGKYFYGNTTSIAPGISTISVYEANDWIQSGFLRLFYWNWQPEKGSSRIANHSWVADAGSSNAEILSRLDWVVDTDEFIQVTALNNGTSGMELMSNGYNIIAVGRTDGSHPYGTIAVDDMYTAGRTAPHIVVPLTATSYTTPVVSAAAALLVEAGHTDPTLSTDPLETYTTNRNGNIIYNAERSEVIKAVLMAAADRFTNNTGPGEITDYRSASANQTENGLDHRYGAGQLNIYNSYQIISSGEQNSAEDEEYGHGAVAYQGFDYDPDFGGQDNSNSAASYYITADDMHTLLSAALAWNLKIDGGSPYQFDGTATTFDLDLFLYDVTEGGVLIASSNSGNENTENLFVALTIGHEYLIQIQPGQPQEDFNWDFALAWQVRSDLDNDMVPDEIDAFPENPDEWRDNDADGLGDIFEQNIIDFDPDDIYTTLEDVLPEDDFDGDDVSNLQEFVNGSDPTQYDLPGDLNGDCVVNMSDFYILSDNWGKTGPNVADLNGDEKVNMSDFYILSDNWGKTCP